MSSIVPGSDIYSSIPAAEQPVETLGANFNGENVNGTSENASSTDPLLSSGANDVNHTAVNTVTDSVANDTTSNTLSNIAVDSGIEVFSQDSVKEPAPEGTTFSSEGPDASALSTVSSVSAGGDGLVTANGTLMDSFDPTSASQLHQQQQAMQQQAMQQQVMQQQVMQQPHDMMPEIDPNLPPAVRLGLQAAQSVFGQKIDVKLFVGRLPKTMEESELTPLFSEFGEVKETVIIRDRGTNSHKGSAFIKMASITDADAAIRAMHNIKVVCSQLGPMQVKYANGEAERLGLPLDAADPGKDVGKLFIGSLPKEVVEQDVRAVFEPIGPVSEVVLMRDAATGRAKGCAFVKYEFKERAILAVKALHGTHSFPGCVRPLEVKFAETRRQQVAGQQTGIPLGGQILGGQQQPLNAAGAVVGSNLHPRSAGGWTEYFTQDGKPYYHNEATQETQWSKPPDFDRLVAASQTSMLPPSSNMSATSGGGGPGDIAGPPGANVFVFHIPNEWTQADLTQHFGRFGRVISCYIATDKATGRNKGYGFVSFDNIESAANAVMGMNGFNAGTKRLKVSIKTGEEQFVAHLLQPNSQVSHGQQAGGLAVSGANMTSQTRTSEGYRPEAYRQTPTPQPGMYAGMPQGQTANAAGTGAQSLAGVHGTVPYGNALAANAYAQQMQSQVQGTTPGQAQSGLISDQNATTTIAGPYGTQSFPNAYPYTPAQQTYNASPAPAYGPASGVLPSRIYRNTPY